MIRRRDFAALFAAAFLPSEPAGAAVFPVTFRKQSPWEALAAFREPGSDAFPGEKTAMELEQRLGDQFKSRRLAAPPVAYRRIAEGVFEAEYGSAAARPWLESLGDVTSARFFALPDNRVRYEISSKTARGLEHRVGEWEAGPALKPVRETLVTAAHPWFSDQTAELFGDCVSFRDQLRRGVPYWRARLDPACGIDVYGTNGIAVGDIDNDGWDEVYVCQPGGLPNRLYRRTARGAFEDVTGSAGVGVLDNTSSALFADFRNCGRQDLVLLASSGPLYFANQGKGVFRHLPDVFHFARAPQGAFTGMAAADYDNDGRLDLYLCTYVYFQSEDRYRYPVPYHDAQNGPPNFLFHNRLTPQAGGFFEDVTVSSCIDQNNNRFSFAASWCDADGDGRPELYVANDFGRKNLYKFDGERFRDIAAEAGVEDIGPGMSAAWFDYDLDGKPDLYVANMWSAAGQRLASQDDFPPLKAGAPADAYRRHAKGNSLYRNLGGGRFEESGASQGVEMGRWAWSSDGFDFDNDGTPEIYVTCGMITNSAPADLMSFFWRQVVSRSPASAAPAPEYEKGWDALNQWIREDFSWNGREPNVFYARREGRYFDCSGVSGLDFADDSRAFAITDFDGDGCADLLLKSRLGPQVRALRNQCGQARNRLAIDLTGVKSNRDAVGARVEIEVAGRLLVRFVQAGSGFLSQHTKRVHAGLGDALMADRITVRWPSGEVQQFRDWPAGFRYHVTEGSPEVSPKPLLKPRPATPSAAIGGANTQALGDTWLLDPVPLPDRRRGPGFLLLSNGPAAFPPGVPVEHLNVAAEPPETAAAYAILRRYLFDWRGPLELPWLLLIDGDSRIHKSYARVPTAAVLKADLAAIGDPDRITRRLPFPGRYFHQKPERNHYRFGAAYLGAGYPQQALPYLNAAVQAWPGNFKAHLALGQLHLDAGRLTEAHRTLELAAALQPTSPDVWNNLGGVEMARNRFTEAAALFDKALALDATRPYLLANAAQARARLGQNKEAEDLFRRALAKNPEDADVSDQLGLLLAQQGRLDEAKSMFQQAIQIQPAHASAINNIAVLYLQSGQRGEAVAALEYGLRVAPDNELLYLNLARLWVSAQNRQRARDVLNRLLERNPSSQVARRALDQLGEP